MIGVEIGRCAARDRARSPYFGQQTAGYGILDWPQGKLGIKGAMMMMVDDVDL